MVDKVNFKGKICRKKLLFKSMAVKKTFLHNLWLSLIKLKEKTSLRLERQEKTKE